MKIIQERHHEAILTACMPLEYPMTHYIRAMFSRVTGVNSLVRVN